MRTPGVSHPSPTTVEDFRRILDERSVPPLFQPLIELDSRHVLGQRRWPGAGGLGPGDAGGPVRGRVAGPLLRRLVPDR